MYGVEDSSVAVEEDDAGALLTSQRLGIRMDRVFLDAPDDRAGTERNFDRNP